MRILPGDKATTSEATPTTATEEIVRIDHSINDKWQILGHYLHDTQATGEADADLGWNSETYNTITSVESNPSNSAAIKLTGEISSSLLVEASMNYDGNIINITNSPNVLTASGWVPDTLLHELRFQPIPRRKLERQWHWRVDADRLWGMAQRC